MTDSKFINNKIVLPKFSSRNELKTYLQMHMPIAIRPTKPAKTTFVAAFTSVNAEQIVLEAMVDALIPVIKSTIL